MLISFNWLRDYVEIPADLDPRDLAERFTVTVAEVEGVERIEVGARGLVAAEVKRASALPGTGELRHMLLDTGPRGQIETVSAAPALKTGDRVVFAPPDAHVAALGEIRPSTVAGHASQGMILPGEAVGIALAVQEAVFLPPRYAPGAALPAELFDDWVIEVDNKSITHRPDLWGHYGIAREIAAMLKLPLKPYPVVPIEELTGAALPEIPIVIDDPEKCPRYSGLVMRGVTSQPSDLWMQLRLGHVGMRPIDCLVDLTNYIMCDLGQPMHAFDADKVRQIEVAVARPGERFVTLDGVERKLPDGALMIQSQRRNVAIAGVMGGRETEVSPQTRAILLESANFEPATIRRCASALGLRTEASARFEKSLDPNHTVLALQRFVYLAKREFSGLQLASKLSDCYPKPLEHVSIEVDPDFASRFIGRNVTAAQIAEILAPLAFHVKHDGRTLRVDVPTFRATKDIRLEVDVIEELARFIGFGNITPELPEAMVRYFEPNPMRELEANTLDLFCKARGYSEIHQYIWCDAAWMKRLGLTLESAIELRNPAAAGMHQLRQALMPGLLAAIERNRHHFSEFKLLELGSVFFQQNGAANERRRLALIVARRQKGADDALLAEMKGDIETWTAWTLNRPASFTAIAPDENRAAAWESPQRSARVVVGNLECGRIGVLPLALKRAADEHLAAWSVAWAELELDGLTALEPVVEKLAPLPEFPQVELDFSFVVPASERYTTVRQRLATFEHPLLQRIAYVGAYEGKSVGAGLRSLTFRVWLAAERTLTEQDTSEFRRDFEAFLSAAGYKLRT
ncbi:MAG TPA: phenylalanine--tRNA ligase subunit beta [Phycisphaerae bacterium]|jgi:phenylalanyl-tRNA synthetase beta chain